MSGSAVRTPSNAGDGQREAAVVMLWRHVGDPAEGGSGWPCGVCRVFVGVPEQVCWVRDFVARQLARRGCPKEAAEEIILCVVELVTNALRHTRSCRGFGGTRPGDGRFLVSVDVDVAGSRVRVEVADAGPAEDFARGHEHEVSGGRGLWVVASLADAMGREGNESLGRTWFTYSWPSSRGVAV